MHKDYLICYDISDTKRLAKLARYLEKISLRVQNSIYLMPNTTPTHIQTIAQEIAVMIDAQADDVRIYTIIDHGHHLGSAYDLKEPMIFI